MGDDNLFPSSLSEMMVSSVRAIESHAAKHASMGHVKPLVNQTDETVDAPAPGWLPIKAPLTMGTVGGNIHVGLGSAVLVMLRASR